MSDVVSFAEIDGQQVELLPARTLLQTPTGGSGPESDIDATLAGLIGGAGGGDPISGLLSGLLGGAGGGA